MLIEALIGILIFSIGILALIAMQAVAIQNNVEARYRTEASFLANEILAQMWVDRGSNGSNLPNYDTGSGADAHMTAWRTRVAATLPGVTAGGTNSPTITVTNLGSNLYAVSITVFWKRPDANAPTRNFMLVSQIGN